MKKTFIILMCLLLLPLVNGLTIEQNAEVNISHPVRAGGSPSAAIECNITVFDSQDDITVDFQPMTNGFDEHYYTLTNTETDVLGCGRYDITCTDGANNRTDSFEYCITPTGEEKETKDWELPMIIVVFGLMSIFLLTAFIFGKKQETLKTLFISLALGLGVVLSRLFGVLVEANVTGTEAYDRLITLGTTIDVITIALFILWIAFILIKYTIKTINYVKDSQKPKRLIDEIETTY